jgi:hypothetical protein
MNQILSNPVLQPILGALVAAVVTFIGTTVGLYVSWVAAKKKQLDIAAAASVQLVEAKAQPAMHLPHDPTLRAELKKEMADGITEALLAGSSKKLIAKVGDAVQKAWNADDLHKRESLANSERPTPPETPSAIKRAGGG